MLLATSVGERSIAVKACEDIDAGRVMACDQTAFDLISFRFRLGRLQGRKIIRELRYTGDKSKDDAVHVFHEIRYTQSKGLT